jgi:hypothetical protein
MGAPDTEVKDRVKGRGQLEDGKMIFRVAIGATIGMLPRTEWATLPATSRRGFGAPRLAISSPTVHR